MKEELNRCPARQLESSAPLLPAVLLSSRAAAQTGEGPTKETAKASKKYTSHRQSLDQQPVQLDFHFARGSQGIAHWHGLLLGRMLFLDTPRLVLDVHSRESLAKTLEYIEENTEADRVFVNFHKSRRDRGDLLRAFGFLGFELVRPDHPALPPWEDALFMVYPMERESCPEKEETLKAGLSKGQDGGTLPDSLLE